MCYQRDRVSGRICIDSGLCDERMRFVSTGCCRRISPAQLRTGVPHVGGGRTAWTYGLRRTGVVGVRLGPRAFACVAYRRGPCHDRTRSATGASHVIGLLLRHGSTTLVRHGRPCKSSQ